MLDGVAAMSVEFGRCGVVTDQQAAAEVLEGLRARGVRRVDVRAWGTDSQTAAFRSLRARVYSEAITLPADEQLVSELCRVRAKLRSGSSQIELPHSGDSHCDMAVAVAAGVLELDRHPSRTARVDFAPLLRRVPEVGSWESGGSSMDRW